VLNHNEVIFDVVTRDALLVYDGQIHRLEGPFHSREDAYNAAEEMVTRLAHNDFEGIASTNRTQSADGQVAGSV
jgi:hypothetical protein